MKTTLPIIAFGSWLALFSCQPTSDPIQEGTGFRYNGTSWVADRVDFANGGLQNPEGPDTMEIDIRGDRMSGLWYGNASGNSTVEIVELVDELTALCYCTDHSLESDTLHFENRYYRIAFAEDDFGISMTSYDFCDTIEEARDDTTVVFGPVYFRRSDFAPCSTLNGRWLRADQTFMDPSGTGPVPVDDTSLVWIDGTRLMNAWATTGEAAVSSSRSDFVARIDHRIILARSIDQPDPSLIGKYHKTTLDIDPAGGTLTITTYRMADTQQEARDSTAVFWGPKTYDLYSPPESNPLNGITAVEPAGGEGFAMDFRHNLWVTTWSEGDENGYSLGIIEEISGDSGVNLAAFHSVEEYGGRYFRFEWIIEDGRITIEASLPCDSIPEAESAQVGEGHGGWSSNPLTIR